MSSLARRGAVIAAAVAGLAWAAAADDKAVPTAPDPRPVCGPCRPRTAVAEPPPTTPDQILRDKVVGDVRVELEVEGWFKYQGFRTGPDEPQTLVLKGAAPDFEQLAVLVGPKVFARLKALGIADPKAHFVGKTVVVSGKVYRNPAPYGSTSIVIRVNDLAQVESITKK